MNIIKHKVILKVIGNHVKIYINGFIHIQFRCDEFVGLQSTVEGTNWFRIYFYTKYKIIQCEYETKELWTAILNEIDKAKL